MLCTMRFLFCFILFIHSLAACAKDDSNDFDQRHQILECDLVCRERIDRDDEPSGIIMDQAVGELSFDSEKAIKCRCPQYQDPSYHPIPRVEPEPILTPSPDLKGLVPCPECICPTEFNVSINTELFFGPESKAPSCKCRCPRVRPEEFNKSRSFMHMRSEMIKMVLGPWEGHTQKPSDEKSKNIGSINLNNQAIGTGFVISTLSKHVFTNAHIALLLQNTIAGGDVQFKTGFESRRVLSIALVDKVLDLAVLETEPTQMPDSSSFLISTEPLIQPTDLIVVGNIPASVNGSPSGLVESFGKCYVPSAESEKQERFFYDANTLPGMSGSPIFNLKNQIIGIHTGSFKNVTNRGIPIEFVFKKYPAFFEPL